MSMVNTVVGLMALFAICGPSAAFVHPCPALRPARVPWQASIGGVLRSPARRRALRARMTASANENLLAEEESSDEGFGQYMKQLPGRLLAHLREGKLDEDGRVLTKKYIIELEQQQNFPYDVDFFHWAIKGKWDLLYSSSRLLTPDPNLRVRSVQVGELCACMPAWTMMPAWIVVQA